MTANESKPSQNVAFRGYKARLRGRVVWVANKQVIRLTSGEMALCCRIQYGHYVGCVGWSGGCREQYRFDEKKAWVRAEKLAPY